MSKSGFRKVCLHPGFGKLEGMSKKLAFTFTSEYSGTWYMNTLDSIENTAKPAIFFHSWYMKSRGQKAKLVWIYSSLCCNSPLKKHMIHPPVRDTAAAAKLLRSCTTLCDPIDGSPPDSEPLGFSRQEHWSGFPFPSLVSDTSFQK